MRNHVGTAAVLVLAGMAAGQGTYAPVTADDVPTLKLNHYFTADRKGGHILSGVDGDVYGVDHGLCLHTEDKLRTVLWGWAGQSVGDDALAAVSGLIDTLSGPLADSLQPHVSAAEIAALRARACGLLNDPVMPGPDRYHPIPWPAF